MTVGKKQARAAPSAEARMEFLLGLRRRGIRDTNVLRALEKVPRERFVGEEQAELAFADRALPIDCGQTISQPYVVAAMTEALDVRPNYKVLEIGTGSGYQAAILAHLAKSVVSIERYRTLADEARTRLASLDLANVTVLVGDGTEGARDYGPFERIIVTAATPEIPKALIEQLATGGILLAPVGPRDGVQMLTRFEKGSSGKLAADELMAVRFVPLVAGKAVSL
jgi:protein-L-isoaspartate(D-aspartate) O-methyltransferase